MLLYDRNIIGPSSEIFGYLRKMSEKCSKTFVFPSEQLWKIFGNLRKVVRNKQNITCPLVDINFIFSCSTRYLNHSLRSLVIYRVELSKIKFISTGGHVISSISSHVKRSPSSWLRNRSRPWERRLCLTFHWCLYNKQNITCPLVKWVYGGRLGECKAKTENSTLLRRTKRFHNNHGHWYL